jgi:hypothetical protein
LLRSILAGEEGGGYLQVATLKETEETLGMLLLLVGRLLEDVGDLGPGSTRPFSFALVQYAGTQGLPAAFAED